MKTEKQKFEYSNFHFSVEVDEAKKKVALMDGNAKFVWQKINGAMQCVDAPYKLDSEKKAAMIRQSAAIWKDYFGDLNIEVSPAMLGE